MIPQIIFIILLAVGFGMSVILHGKPRTPHNFYSGLIATCITCALLFLGGFFDKLLGK